MDSYTPDDPRSRPARPFTASPSTDGGPALELPASLQPLPLRVWQAWRQRGTRYAAHKALRRSLARWPGWKRRLVYADPRAYWTLRGGPDYFREQEDHPSRSLRAEWLAERVAAYQPTSILEVGCGYGKQLD